MKFRKRISFTKYTHTHTHTHTHTQRERERERAIITLNKVINCSIKHNMLMALCFRSQNIHARNKACSFITIDMKLSEYKNFWAFSRLSNWLIPVLAKTIIPILVKSGICALLQKWILLNQALKISSDILWSPPPPTHTHRRHPHSHTQRFRFNSIQTVVKYLQWLKKRTIFKLSKNATKYILQGWM